jgi:ribosomal protein S18 acetylase RimI-like enzyme
MGLVLDDIRLDPPEVAIGTLEWSEYLRLFDLPPGLLAAADRSAFHLVVARIGGEPVTAALAFDHGTDCGVYNLGTLEHMRRRGVASALTARMMLDARARG